MSFKLKQTHAEGGDCTAPYDVILDKSYTVAEFVAEILKCNPKEWGIISIATPKGYIEINYYCGKIEELLPEVIGNTSVLQVKASGGWSRMDYSIKADK